MSSRPYEKLLLYRSVFNLRDLSFNLFEQTKAMQHSFVKKFEEAVDAEAKIKHSKLATEVHGFSFSLSCVHCSQLRPQVEDDIFEPTKIKIKTLKKDQIDISYQPIIQSGGCFTKQFLHLMIPCFLHPANTTSSFRQKALMNYFMIMWSRAQLVHGTFAAFVISLRF